MQNKNSRWLRLGITGGAGSGKSVVCRRLQSRGAAVIMSDELSRRAVEPGMPAYEKIVRQFGETVLAADGAIDRAGLRAVIIRDPEKKKTLEAIVHPEVFRLMAADEAEAVEKGAAVVAIEVPLLFETGMQDAFDCIATIHVDREIRIQRLIKRDRISRADAEALMQIQWPEAEKQSRSDFVIDNTGSLDATRAAVDKLYRNLLERLKNH